MNGILTRSTLIERIRDQHDEQAWNEFVTIYAPLIFTYSLKRGLQESDAADVVQDVLQIILGAVAKFDLEQEGASFRGWLFTITLNCIRRRCGREKKQVAGSGRTTIAQAIQEQPATEQDVWDRETKQRLFQWACEQVRGEFKEQTWKAFWLTCVEGRKTADVAHQLEISLSTVYVSKCRIITRIREKIAYVDAMKWS